MDDHTSITTLWILGKTGRISVFPVFIVPPSSPVRFGRIFPIFTEFFKNRRLFRRLFEHCLDHTSTLSSAATLVVQNKTHKHNQRLLQLFPKENLLPHDTAHGLISIKTFHLRTKGFGTNSCLFYP
jgi:hypothetical protein